MSTVGLMRVKNEQDVIETTVRHLASQVDEVLVADNLSTDGTSDILAGLTSELPLSGWTDPEFANHGGHIMSMMAQEAFLRGHEWAVACDADEIWLAPMRIADLLAQTTAGTVAAILFNHVPTSADVKKLDPVRRMTHRKLEPQPMRWGRYAFRLSANIEVAQGNHHMTPFHHPVVVGLEIRHFPYRSLDQWAIKAANGKAVYDATDFSEGTGVTWREHGRIAEQGHDALVRYWNEHILWTDVRGNPELVEDPCPI